MKHFIALMTLFIFSEAVYSKPELEFEKIYFNRDKIELSSLHHIGDSLLFVGDKLSNRAIYKIKFENNRFYYSNYIDLSKLQGHKKYFADVISSKHGGRFIKSPFDLEGLTSCGKDFYLVNEQVRHVIAVKQSSMDYLPLNFSNTFKKAGYPLEKVSTNAGFEGIAADCRNKKLYIAQERSPRGIIQIDLKTNTIEDQFLFSNKEGEYGSFDYADLYFEKGYLYLLERNAHIISKYDLKTKKIIASVSFGRLDSLHLRNLYDTGEKYGLAEGITMTKDSIYIGVDNNKNPISKAGQKKFSIKGKFSSLILFKRPKGF